MDQSLSFYTEELYSRAYYLFLQCSSLRQMTSSAYMSEEQKLMLAKSQLEALSVEIGNFANRTNEIYEHFYVDEPEQ